MMDTPPKLWTLVVVSDSICPWCFLGKRRIEAAQVTLAAEGLNFDLEWRPFQLNPDMPDVGMNRPTYRAAKYGAAESAAMDRQITRIGQEVGIGFRYDLIERTPNTMASHVMIADALRAGGTLLQNRAVEAVFQAYFTQGRDIGNKEVLRDIARDVGFEHGPAIDPGLWETVELLDRDARRAGIRGVPSVLLGEDFLFSGAQPAEMIVTVLRQAVGFAGDRA